MHDCGSWISREAGFLDEAKRFVALHYLRQFHRPVWRLIERQPDAVQILRGVLANEPPGTEAPIPGWRVGLLREIFVRSFFHVLEVPDRDPDDPDDRNAPLRHGRQTLDEAVTAALERRDRHRSDTSFCELFLSVFERPNPAANGQDRQRTAINPLHLCLVAPEQTRPEPQTPAPDLAADDRTP
jgi:hypothetical protein